MLILFYNKLRGASNTPTTMVTWPKTRNWRSATSCTRSKKSPRTSKNTAPRASNWPKTCPCFSRSSPPLGARRTNFRDLKTQLAALDRKIQLSLAPVEQNPGEPDGLDGPDDLDDFDYLDEGQGQETDRQSHREDSTAIPDRLKDYKDVLGDRLVICSPPPPEPEPEQEIRPRGMRM